MSHLESQMDNMFHSGESERESLIEELETLRASNTIKQANIELLEAENAKLIADQSVNLNSLAKSFGDEFIVDPEYYYISNAIEHLIKDRLAMQAEREAMMKQEPVFYATKNLNIVITAETYNCGTDIGQADYPVPLYTHPLPAQQIPTLTCYKCGETKCEVDFYDDRCIICAVNQAQQIPEGWRLVPEEPTDKMIEFGWRRQHPEAIYKDMLHAAPSYQLLSYQLLSASQPKGDV